MHGLNAFAHYISEDGLGFAGHRSSLFDRVRVRRKLSLGVAQASPFLEPDVVTIELQDQSELLTVEELGGAGGEARVH